MGYLDNSTIVVDAVLTKEGRKRLAAGNGLGIEYFTLSDSGIDYRLWNPDHPSGSAFYGEAIENLPSLEAIPRAEFYMRNKLITLNKDVTGLPYWTSIPDILINNNPGSDPVDPTTNTYSGVIQEFEFKQQAPGDTCLLIIENSLALESVNVHSDCQLTDIGGGEDLSLSYQALINLESQNAHYYQITNITGAGNTGGTAFRLNFKRNNVDITTNATIIDLSSGIYKTFKIDVDPK